jgi:hypothetical protein
MGIVSIKKELAGVVFEESRADNPDYFEAVVVRDELTKLTAVLERVFGLPVSVSRKPLPSGVENKLKAFGGIRSGQALYLFDEGQDPVFAMLWPWQDGWRTTLKIIQV